MPNITDFPDSFEELKKNPPEGYSLSSRLIDPVILIDKNEFIISARLAGVRLVDGKKKIFPTFDNKLWVVDEKTIRPIPKDTRKIFSKLIKHLDSNNLSYREVIQVIRNNNSLLPIELTEAFLESGKSAAEHINENVTISELNAKLFPYQSRGVIWMWNTIKYMGGLILADEMGLGKTLQVIALLLIEPPNKNTPALIICPTSLIANWVREIERFAPTLSVKVHRGMDRTGVYRGLQNTNIVITTYDTMVNDISLFTSLEWSWVIADEAQAIKNPDSIRRKAIISIPRQKTIPMTGTPVENSLLDLWSLVDFAIPDILGTRSEFEINFPDHVESAQKIRAFTDPLILKRRVVDVAEDLPTRIDIDVPIELDEYLTTQYEKVRKITLEKYPIAGALVATLQLQLFCAHPWLRRDDETDLNEEDAVILKNKLCDLITPKMERALDLLHECFANGKKVIIFSLFNRIFELLKESYTGYLKVYWGAINGSTLQGDRQSIIDSFSAYDGPGCLVLNPKAAGSGLNITAATVVIHFTPVWNPALEAQASARAHRRGQTQPVTIYRLFYKDTVEEIMIERAQWKSELANESVPTSTRDKTDLSRALEISPRKK